MAMTALNELEIILDLLTACFGIGVAIALLRTSGRAGGTCLVGACLLAAAGLVRGMVSARTGTGPLGVGVSVLITEVLHSVLFGAAWVLIVVAAVGGRRPARRGGRR